MRDILFFDSMITPKIITFIYWILLAGNAIAGLVLLGIGFSQGIIMGTTALIGVPLLVVLWALLARIYCEIMIVLFKMNEALQDIRNK